jgi:uncharacterized phage protein gp47/JayE
MAIYGVKNKSEILVSILNGLEKNAGITAIYPGSIARAFAESVSAEISDLYEAFRFTVSQSNLSTASGRNLDLIGDLYGVSRKSVTNFVAEERQSFNVEFFIDKPHSAGITIPAGTLLYNDVSNFTTKQYSYKLSSTVSIPAGATRSYGRAEPNFSDNSYVAPKNSLTKHNFIAPPTVVVFSNNPKEIYSNITSESDDNYRRRILASMKTKAPGTVESVRFAALSVKGVKDVRIREASYGIGSCDVIVVPEVSSAIKALPQAILSAISAVKPVGVRFNVRVAEKISINVSATITIPSGNSDTIINGVRNQAAMFVKRYLNSMTIGNTVSLSEIEQQIKLSSDLVRGVTINTFTADGKELPLRDFMPNSIKEYVTAGSVNIYSVIIGSSNY